MQQQVCRLQLLQRRAERRDQLHGELLHEADGVGEQEREAGRDARAGGAHSPRGRVECGEGLVGDEHLGAGQRAHQR